MFFKQISFMLTVSSLLIVSGCSGAPVLSENNGNLFSVGNVTPNQKLIYQIMKGEILPDSEFELFDEPENIIIDYQKYGGFVNAGTDKFVYRVNDFDGLKKDSIAGFYPNEPAIRKDPQLVTWKFKGIFKNNAWESLGYDNKKQAFYIWSQSNMDVGTKMFFIGSIMEDAGHIMPAINAYYSSIIFYPRAYCFSENHDFVWYPSQAAMFNIKRLAADYPELNLDYTDYKFEVKNGYDPDTRDDVIMVHPGFLVKRTLKQKIAGLPDLAKMNIAEKRGGGRVNIVKFNNGHWQMFVDGKPFFVRGISYSPTEIGAGPHTDFNFMERWMFADNNHNGLIDAAYDAWVDANNNNLQDTGEKSVGDFKLLKDIGINTIRLYAPNNPKDRYDPDLINKNLLRKMYEDFGIMVAVGDFLGAYTLGSGARWDEGTDYTDPQQLKSMKEVVRQKVMDLKDEPFVLMWILGNENNMSLDYNGVNATRTNAGLYPQAYASFLNEVAKMIHEIDGNHPVAVGNIELDLLDYYKKHAPELDILGVNSYRSAPGFQSLWQDARALFDRPVVITEYGCDAYSEGEGEDQNAQLKYIKGKFKDIVLNSAGGYGEGNSIGGFIFEFLDEWWKDSVGDPEDVQQIKPQFPFGSPDGWGHEEWLGIVGQGNGKDSPFKRQLRKAYLYFKEFSD